MNEQATVKSLPEKLVGYYLIPHELLHVLAFRLIGKPCHYEWGDRRVQYSARLSRREHLFTLLLPGATTLAAGLFLHAFGLLIQTLAILSASAAQMTRERYLSEFPLWHLAFPAVATLFILYSGTAYRDVRVALRLLFGKKEAYQDGHEQHR